MSFEKEDLLAQLTNFTHLVLTSIEIDYPSLFWTKNHEIRTVLVSYTVSTIYADGGYCTAAYIYTGRRRLWSQRPFSSFNHNHNHTSGDTPYSLIHPTKRKKKTKPTMKSPILVFLTVLLSSSTSFLWNTNLVLAAMDDDEKATVAKSSISGKIESCSG